MNSDFQVSTGFFHHRKTLELEERHGCEGLVCLLKLWAFAATERIDGDLSGISAARLERIVEWPGDPGAFVQALEAIGFLDRHQQGYRIHDWPYWNEYASKAQFRIEQAKLAAEARWRKRPRPQPEPEPKPASVPPVEVVK